MKCKCGGVARQQSNDSGTRKYKCGSCFKNFKTLEFHEMDAAVAGLVYIRDQISDMLAKESRSVLRAKGYLQK
jgi:hypothetical protein